MKGVIFIVLHVVVYHGLYKDAVALCGFVDKHMGDGAHQPAVLDNGRSAHALHDAPCFSDELRIRDFHHHGGKKRNPL